MISGIYLITNKINNHMYVGGSIDIERRFREHKRGADANTQAIDRAILKYGKENFTYQIITELPADWEVITKHEKYWIKFYNTFKNTNHYNLTNGGDFFIMSPESRRKISESMKGENNPMYGKEPWNKGKTGCYSNETIQKMSEAKYGENHPNWKNHARIINHGFNSQKKQQYAIRFNSKVLKRSISIDKLIKWFNENYPNEELVIDVKN